MIKSLTLSNFVSVAICLCLSLALFTPLTANAVTAADWRPGRIIDDGIFTDSSSMSVAQIQAFLNSKVPTCDTWGTQTSELGGGTRAQYGASHNNPAPFTCLKDYYEVSKTTPGPGLPANNYGGKPIPPGAQSAAQLIWNASQKYKISPKVLLVKIATESAGPLTSDDWPFLKQYTYAMGSHCPDSGPGGSANCDQNYAGFSMQIDSAASLMRWYLDSMTQPWWQYKRPYQNNNILWNIVESNCGGSNVYIESMGTAALYTYTPYQPNQAALNNMYGTGNGCSAYGNRNFWRVFNDWFGSTQFPQPAGASIYRQSTTGTIFLVSDNVKYQVPDWSMMENYGLSGYPTIPATDSMMTSFTDGGLLTNLLWDSGGVYLVNNRTRHPIPGEMCTAWNLPCFDSAKVMALNSTFQTQFLKQNINLTNAIYINGSIYKVSGGSKQPIANPQSLKDIGMESTPLITVSRSNDTLVLGTPIVTTPGVVKFSPKNKIYYFDGSQYFSVPDMGIYDDYRLYSASSISIPWSSYNLPDVEIPSQPLSSWIERADGGKLLIDNGRSLTIPTELQSSFSANQYAISYPVNLVSKLKQETLREHVWSYPKQFVLRDGKKRYVPSHYDYVTLGASTSNQSVMKIGKLANTPEIDHIFGNGKTIRLEGHGGAVYTIDGAQILHIPDEPTLNGFGFSWGDIATYKPSDILSYTLSGGSLQKSFKTTDGTVYIVSDSRSYIIPKEFVTDFGVKSGELTEYQTGTASRMKPQPITRFIRNSTSGAIYYASGGDIHHIQSMSAFYRYGGGSAKSIIPVNNETLNLFTIGSPLQ